MASRSMTAIEAAVKVRSGKKWKKRYCVLQRESPIFSDIALLSIYKNVKCGLKSTREPRSVRLEGFYGLETGFLLDKERFTLAIICQPSVVVIAFENDYSRHCWELWLRDLFGHGCQYSVLALKLPWKFAAFENTTIRLHVRDKRFCLVRQTPPDLIAGMSFEELRRFGSCSGKRFVIEVGTRAGDYAGVYAFLSDTVDSIGWAFNMACESRLNDRLCSRDNYENMAGRDGSTTMTTSTDGSIRYIRRPPQSRWLLSPSPGHHVNHFSPKDAASTRKYEPTQSNNSVKGSRQFDVQVTNAGKPSGAILLHDGTIRHQPKTKTKPYSSVRQAAADIKARAASLNDDSCGYAVSRHHRPTSVCEPRLLSSRKLLEGTPAARPLSEMCQTPIMPNDAKVILPMPVPPSACSQCRNYVNQPFIDSLQYYYNVDHVVLALSKKSKCCDHDCAAQNDVYEQQIEENNKILLAAAAKVNEGKLSGESVSVNVPSTDYAAMAPKGGLYVLMEPCPVSPVRNKATSPATANAQRRHSETSVPPDDPLHMDEPNVVTVPPGEASNVAVARSGIIVKPFEPLLLTDRRTSRSMPTDHWRRSVSVEERSKSVPSSAKVELARSKSRGRRNVYGAKSKFLSSQCSSYRATKSEERTQEMVATTDTSLDTCRSASFAARDAWRSSSRCTRIFFDRLARRASSAVFRRRSQNRHSIADGSIDGRISRAKSEPPSVITHDRENHSFLDRLSILTRKWRDSVDLDEVIYEGTPFSSSNARSAFDSTISDVANNAQKISRQLIGPQRSIGTESTWSTDSNMYRAPRRLANQRSVDVSDIFDSVSIVSEISDSDIFVNETWHNGSSAVATTSAASPKTCIDSSIRGKRMFPSFLDRNEVVEIRSKKMDEMTRRRVRESTLTGSFSGYDGDKSSDSHYGYSCTDAMKKMPHSAQQGNSAFDSANYSSPAVDRCRIEKRIASYSPPPPFDCAMSPGTAEKNAKISTSKRHARALPPPKTVEGEFFKFPPFPITIDDDSADSTLLNYATLATLDPVTPTSAGAVSRARSLNSPSMIDAKPIEYAKIDELATQAARKAVTTSRQDECRTWSDGEHSIDTSRSVPCPESSLKGRRDSVWKKSLLRRRLSFASLSGV